MFEQFCFNVVYGIRHVIDINAYDHVLFLVGLIVPYGFKHWRKGLLLLSAFTLGHTLSLTFASYEFVSVNASLVEFLIPLSILIVAIYNALVASKAGQKGRIGLLLLTTLFFGLIHGLGFAREFRMLLGDAEDKLTVLLEFALGIEISQVIVVFFVLCLNYLGQQVFRIPKRPWILVITTIVIGLVIPMLLKSDYLA